MNCDARILQCQSDCANGLFTSSWQRATHHGVARANNCVRDCVRERTGEAANFALFNASGFACDGLCFIGCGVFAKNLSFRTRVFSITLGCLSLGLSYYLYRGAPDSEYACDQQMRRT
jgi:hypothetical protein